jgi:putative SOS response-associated peptidase YedK
MKLEYSTTNATAERLVESRVYNRLLDRCRCLIPVNGFYEWHGSKPPKTPFYVHLKSNELFALAGLWDTWTKPDGAILESFAIITTEPNELMRTIHRRMPLILHRDNEQKWLDCSANDFNRVRSLVKPFPSDLMAAHEVSNRVNDPRYDEPDCVAPFESQGSLAL